MVKKFFFLNINKNFIKINNFYAFYENNKVNNAKLFFEYLYLVIQSIKKSIKIIILKHSIIL